MSDVRQFLLEIGTEEIPASYLAPAAAALSDDLKSSLKREGITVDSLKPLWSPRRLSLLASLSVSSPEKTEERQGPPAKVAKDQNGNWTVAAKKFAESLSVDESALFIKESEKGNYVCVKRSVGGEQTSAILQRILPEVIKKIPFPKNMRWPQAANDSFARPVRWICCLFGEEVVKIEFAGLSSSNTTRGHRFAHPEAITINNPVEYVQKLKEAYVLVDREERKAYVVKELTSKAEALGGELVPNGELVEEVTDLVEYPKALDCNLGTFADLPREVLETALAKHQRAFVVEKKSKLIPHFLVVTNAPMLDPALVRPWFERMSVSRLEDAEFFIKEDLEKGMEPLVAEESRVEWIKGIGTLAQKTEWLSTLGLFIGGATPGFDRATYERAAYLAKADLLSNLVREKEFTSLQGIAGGIYAAKLGEPQAVSTAIREQYSDTPSTTESTVLGISDRLLNIAATFVLGKPPKGSSDPFALRRQATAIARICVEGRLSIDLASAVKKALEIMGKEQAKSGEISDFLTDRLRLFLIDRGFAYDWVDAVLAVASSAPYDCFIRLQAFRELNKGEEFKQVAVGQKRLANITRSIAPPPPPSSAFFSEPSERTLWAEAERARPLIERACESKNYKKALELLLSIRPAIDKFFDDVFVMVEDEKVRANRLGMLAAIRGEFLKVADFSKIVVESNNP